MKGKFPMKRSVFRSANNVNEEPACSNSVQKTVEKNVRTTTTIMRSRSIDDTENAAHTGIPSKATAYTMNMTRPSSGCAMRYARNPWDDVDRAKVAASIALFRKNQTTGIATMERTTIRNVLLLPP